MAQKCILPLGHFYSSYFCPFSFVHKKITTLPSFLITLIKTFNYPLYILIFIYLYH
jgi:hypothetical protein